MASSEGSREIDAAKKRLAAAEARAAADAKMAEMARQNAQASALEVQEARKCLQEAEERWEVVAIDDDSDAEESELIRKYKTRSKRFRDSGVWGTYEGELNEDCTKREGKGKMNWDDGDVYDGEWKNDQCDGQGTLKCSNGDVYEGEWKNGESEGQGTHRYINGDVYEGEWKNDMMNGQGTYRHADGNVFRGKFRNGKTEGEGCCRYTNGEMFVGNYKDDKRNGRGTYYWTSGEVDIGVYKDGKDTGEGVRWSKDRQTAWLLKDEEKERKISLTKAEEMATQMGFDGVPPAAALDE